MTPSVHDSSMLARRGDSRVGGEVKWRIYFPGSRDSWVILLDPPALLLRPTIAICRAGMVVVVVCGMCLCDVCVCGACVCVVGGCRGSTAAAARAHMPMPLSFSSPQSAKLRTSG